MKKIILIVLIANIFYCCEEKKKYVTDDVINVLNEDILKKGKSKNGLILPLAYSYLPIFGLTENNFLVCTSTDGLYYVYINFYKKEFVNFRDFLSAFLNQKIIVPKKKFNKTSAFFIMLDKKVSEDYKNYSFLEFYNKYCLTDNNVTSIKLESYRNEINRDKLYSIIYYLSINNYYVDESDYIGLYYVKRWNDVIKR